MDIRFAHGHKEHIPSAIDSGVIPKGTLIITKDDESEILFYGEDGIVKSLSGALHIDNKTILRSDDGLLHTAIGGYDDSVNISWDGNTDGLVAVTASYGDYYKVSDNPLSISQVTGATIMFNSFGQIYSAEAVVMSGDGFICLGSAEQFGLPATAVVALEDNVDVYGDVIPEKGIYFLEAVGEDGAVAYMSGLSNSCLEQIDAKFLPITKTLSSSSNDAQIPSAKSVYDAMQEISGRFLTLDTLPRYGGEVE